VVIVSAVYAFGLIIWTLPHWWLRIGTAEPRVAVYKSWSGDVLFVVRYDSMQEQYIFTRPPTRSEFLQPVSYTLARFSSLAAKLRFRSYCLQIR
jgi:hypothetical protein